MRKLMSLILGIGVGGTLGAGLVALLSPTSGKAFREELKRGFEDTLEEARIASEERQRQLEAELEEKLGKRVITSK